jgi:hypothetical protein
LLYVLLLLLLLLLLLVKSRDWGIHRPNSALIAEWAMHATADSGVAVPQTVLVGGRSGPAATIVERKADE